MRLQINANGSWREVVEFDSSREIEVLDAVPALACVVKKRFRVVDGPGRSPQVFAYLDEPYKRWDIL